jgi:hypothetical protein
MYDPLAPSSGQAPSSPAWPASPHDPSDLPPHLSPSTPSSSVFRQQQARQTPLIKPEEIPRTVHAVVLPPFDGMLAGSGMKAKLTLGYRLPSVSAGLRPAAAFPHVPLGAALDQPARASTFPSRQDRNDGAQPQGPARSLRCFGASSLRRLV